MHTMGSEVSGFIGILIVQIIILILFGLFVRYDYEMLPIDLKNGSLSANDFMAIEQNQRASYPRKKQIHSTKMAKLENGRKNYEQSQTKFAFIELTGILCLRVESHENSTVIHYFQDIHVMIFIGFGYLMTFLKKYGFSSCAFNLLVAALVIQWAFLARGIFQLDNGVIRITLTRIIEADISAAVVLISMGALLGRTTPIQLLLMSLIEVIVYAANEFCQLELLKISDVGGSITVHAFGAYFGLAASYVMRPKHGENEANINEGSTYISDLFAMVGSIFLWIFWPSFNSALLDDISQQHRAILNTYLSLAAATVTTFVMSAIVSHQHKLDMVHIQNSTLAGGVAIGSVCNLLVGPHSAILIGIISAIISVLGYQYLSPILASKLRLHDTCGVHNLHGMPAILSAIFSVIFASTAAVDNYKDSLTDIFPAMYPRNSAYALEHNTSIIAGGFGRTANEQAGYQALAIVSTIVVAVISGLITGMILNIPAVRNLKKDEHHDDEVFWNVPDDFKQI